MTGNGGSRTVFWLFAGWFMIVLTPLPERLSSIVMFARSDDLKSQFLSENLSTSSNSPASIYHHNWSFEYDWTWHPGCPRGKSGASQAPYLKHQHIETAANYRKKRAKIWQIQQFGPKLVNLYNFPYIDPCPVSEKLQNKHPKGHHTPVPLPKVRYNWIQGDWTFWLIIIPIDYQG